MMRIRNVCVPITTNALRFIELKHIEKQINLMSVVPDFGYDGDNVLLEKEGAPRNWKLLTEIATSKNKHEWLKNYVYMQKIRRKQEEEEDKRREKANMRL